MQRETHCLFQHCRPSGHLFHSSQQLAVSRIRPVEANAPNPALKNSTSFIDFAIFIILDTIYLYFKILGVSFPEIKTKSTNKIGMRFDGENRDWVIIINQKPLQTLKELERVETILFQPCDFVSSFLPFHLMFKSYLVGSGRCYIIFFLLGLQYTNLASVPKLLFNDFYFLFIFLSVSIFNLSKVPAEAGRQELGPGSFLFFFKYYFPYLSCFILQLSGVILYFLMCRISR